jgi:hypothetical protein
MALTDKSLPGIVASDRDALLKILDEYDRQSGFIPDPTATVEKLRAMMLADGVRPEENSASREIIRIREGEEE